MRFDNFLADTYFGFFDKRPYANFRELKTTERTEKLIRNYLEVSKKFSAPAPGEQNKLSAELIAQLKKIHFFGINIPEAYGGAGLTLLEYLKVVEAVAANSLSIGFTALAHLSIGVKGILLFGTEEQKRKYLPPAARGDMIFAFALTEPKTGSDARHIETAATLSEDGRHYILSGQKTYITNANYAGAMTVFARLDPGQPGFMGAFIVETAWDGVSVGREMPKMGLKASSTAAVKFDNVKVPRENLLARPGDGFKIAMTILNYGRLALGAASTAMMAQSLTDMFKRSASRKQFGGPIQQFDLIQEKMVVAKTNLFVAESITAFTAGMLETDPLAAVAVESSHCKLFGTTRAWDTLYDALQVAGGSGYLATQPYEQRMRDFRVTTIFEGTTEIHSIYPALFMLRKLTGQMKAETAGKFSNIRFLVRMLFQKKPLTLRYKQKQMNRAAGTAAGLAKSIRFLMVAGTLLYGRKILTRQFFLRRITNLSLYFFGLLAILARIERSLPPGSRTEHLSLLAFFTEEALRFKRQNHSLFPYQEDILIKNIFKQMSARAETENYFFR